MLYYLCIKVLSNLIWSMPCTFSLLTMQKTLLNYVFSVEQLSFRNKLYEERLSHLNLFYLEKRWLRGRLIECFKTFKAFTNVDTTNLFEIDDSTRTRNNGAKLECRQVHSDCTKFFFTNVVDRDWNKLPPSGMQCNSIVSLKNNLDSYLLHLNVHWVSFNVMVAA